MVGHNHDTAHTSAAQIIGIAILEFGVVLHRYFLHIFLEIFFRHLFSVLVGLTLAVNQSFKVLFVVLVFHRRPFLFLFLPDLIFAVETFEGLGIGSRLAYMNLPPKYNWVPVFGAALYGLTTPIGIAVGLGARTAYNPGSATATIVSGVLDSLSAGILIYTGLVEVGIFL